MDRRSFLQLVVGALAARRAGRPGPEEWLAAPRRAPATSPWTRSSLDTPKNRYLPNGHNYQRPGLTIYLPGNGGLLATTAMMAAGWDGGPDRHAPGFPSRGWSVRWENLRRMP